MIRSPVSTSLIKDPAGDALSDEIPFVTVVMPVRNERRYIVRALTAVFNQDYPADRFQVIVADGISEDGTADVIRAFQKEHPSLTLIENPGRIVPTGLNAAIRIAKGTIIVRIDGHCEPARDYIRCCVEQLAKGDWVGVGGPIETVGESYVAEAIAAAMSSPFGVGGSAFRTVQDRALSVETVPFPAYTRAAIENAGPYDEEFVRNQDDEYNYRLLDLGGRLYLTPEIRSRYYSRASLGSLWRQYFQYGYWKVRVMQKHPLQMRWRQFVPSAFLIALFSSLLAAPSWYAGRVALVALVCSYLAVVLVGGFWTAARTRWRYLPLLPMAFAALHFSYGLGFMWGLLAFWSRWGDRSGRVSSMIVPCEAESRGAAR